MANPENGTPGDAQAASTVVSPTKTGIHTKNAPPPGGAYSPGLRAGQFVFVSGQGPVDPSSSAVIGSTIEEQTDATLANVQAILAAAGASMRDVVKATVHLRHMSDFDRFNAAYGLHFPDPKPVRTTVGSELVDILVEIDVIAIVGAGGPDDSQ
jgi:2-iminobutanoate/2-iminopropanoate deaminase